MHDTPEASPPEGFILAPVGGVFAAHSGKLFARWRGESLQLGFRVAPHQVNPGNACHGGMLCTFADILLSTAAHYQADIPRQFLPTISLQMDFLAPAPVGSWVQGEAQILKVTKNLLFSQALVQADGVTALRSSGVFRRGALLPDSGSDQALQLPGRTAR
ncbi:PaaI family thioesterase [Variovorax paradoxus]|nr:PaaI family thioesterase [Variovorax paradoxus]MBT2301918.1 PaaI family thioesterase [Variovorax paradoxus]